MQGRNKDGGVMSRAVDVIFNSINDLQTKKFQVKPDKLNGGHAVRSVRKLRRDIYNNNTFDLLDVPKMDIVTGKQKLVSKILSEDSYRNMYYAGQKA